MSDIPVEPVPPILVDYRVGSKDLIPLIKSITGPQIPVIESNLEFGDIAWTGKGPGGNVDIAIERKRVGDLVDSLQSGRLIEHQLPGLHANYRYFWVLIEGSYRPNPHSGILEIWVTGTRHTQSGFWKAHRTQGGRGGLFMYRDLESWLTTLELKSGVHFRKSPDAITTAHECYMLYKYFQKEWEDHKGNLAFYVSGPSTVSFTKPTLVTRMAKEIEGIGWEKAHAIGRRFKSPFDMITANRDDWEQVPGVGKVIACQAIYELDGLTPEQAKDAAKIKASRKSKKQQSGPAEPDTSNQ